MKTWCVLEVDGGRRPDLADLEAAADATASLTRLDCAKLLPGMRGVIATGLAEDEAVAFQGVLKARGIAVSILPDEDLPMPHESYRIQRLELEGGRVLATDAMGAILPHNIDDIVFLAAGFYPRTDIKHPGGSPSMIGRIGSAKSGAARKPAGGDGTMFRMDLFFADEPNRLSLMLHDENSIFFQGEPLRLKNRPALERFMGEMAELLPPERINSQLRDPGQVVQFRSFQHYENEIRWNFARIAGLV